MWATSRLREFAGHTAHVRRTTGCPIKGAHVTPSGVSSQWIGASAKASPTLTAANFIAAINSSSSGTGGPISTPWLRRMAVNSSYQAGLPARGNPTHLNPAKSSSRTPSGPTSPTADSDAISTPRCSRQTSMASNSGPGRRSRTNPTSSSPSRRAANWAEVDNRRGITRAAGQLEVNLASATGRTSGANSSGTPSLMGAPSSVVYSAITRNARSRRAKIALASPKSVIPASVGRTPLLLRTRSLTPTSRSSVWIVWDSVGWLTCNRRAAADIPPSSVTTTNAASSRNSMPTAANPGPTLPCPEPIAGGVGVGGNRES